MLVPVKHRPWTLPDRYPPNYVIIDSRMNRYHDLVDWLLVRGYKIMKGPFELRYTTVSMKDLTLLMLTF